MGKSEKPLSWVPWKIRPPRHLKDFQRSWFDELLWAMFENEEMQGYMSVTSDLAWIAGSHRIDFWDANKSVVMDCFSRATVAGHEVIYYPPLIELIQDQRKFVRGHKKREQFRTFAAEDAFPFLSGFDVGSKNLKPENHKPVEDTREAEVVAEAHEITAIEYAHKVFEELGQPAARNVALVAEAIKALAKRGEVSIAEAFERIKLRAVEDQAVGVKIDRFWFEDGRYIQELRGNNGKQEPARATAQHDRAARNAAAIRRVFGASGVERNSHRTGTR